jgi:hypothetical protein
MWDYSDWIGVIALAVVAVGLCAGLWEIMSHRGQSRRIGRGNQVPGSEPEPQPALDDALPAPHNGVGWLEAGTARWLWNGIALLIEQGKLSGPAATLLRGRAQDDKFMARLYRSHVEGPKRFYASEEESVVAACEDVARQEGCQPATRDPAGPQGTP